MYLLVTHPVRQRVARSSGMPVADHTPAHLARHVGNLFLHGIEAAAGPATVRRKPATRKRSGGSR